MSDQKEEILQLMIQAGKPMRPGDLAKMAGIDGKEVSKMIKELKAEGKVESPKRCFWAPVKND